MKPKCETCPFWGKATERYKKRLRAPCHWGPPAERHNECAEEVWADDWCRHHPAAPKVVTVTAHTMVSSSLKPYATSEAHTEIREAE